ncbi:MAG: S-adenosylmethionine:tRNA ribosyltransferase-isomerase [Bacteroidaceae bacterium]|nr:S-adenosylmethionine:tRNA ribosyltransferase-isomerase [Bacteroidaceae bacterium]
MTCDIQHIRIEDYDYPLPDERIAKFPLAERDSSKLLVCLNGKVSEDRFTSLPHYLPKGALMVFNNTRVIQARLHFRKETGALIEVFCLEPLAPREYVSMFAQTDSCVWLCMVGNLKKWKGGALTRAIEVNGQLVELSVERMDEEKDFVRGTTYCTTSSPEFPVRFSWHSQDKRPITFAEVLQACGELPIPPYLNRETQESDLRTYQTVYSKVDGSVAAPTAGLHFTENVLKALDDCGIERDEVTLHVGAGTFKPVKSEFIGDHAMHSEYIVVRRATIEKLIAHGGEAIAVGTTSVRTLESLYYIGLILLRHPDASEEELHVPQWMPYESADDIPTLEALGAILRWMETGGYDCLHTTTQIIIVPGYKFHIVRRMVTNFHQPKSTLLLLVSAFVGNHADGTPVWSDIYDFALAHDFRFLSYGDSSILGRD